MCVLAIFRVGLTQLSSKVVSRVVPACSVFDDVPLDGHLRFVYFLVCVLDAFLSRSDLPVFEDDISRSSCLFSLL